LNFRRNSPKDRESLGDFPAQALTRPHSDDLVRQMAEVNLLGMIWGARAAIGAMRDNGGHLINIASLSSITPVPGLAIYGATKQAVLGFSISLAGDLEHAAIPVKVSAVGPDGIDTDVVRTQKRHQGGQSHLRRAAASNRRKCGARRSRPGRQAQARRQRSALSRCSRSRDASISGDRPQDS